MLLSIRVSILYLTLTLGFAAYVSSLKFSQAKIDCSDVKLTSLEELESKPSSPCRQALELANSGHARASTRLDLVHSCTCNLVNRDNSWIALLNADLELLYSITRSIIEPRESGCNEVTFLDLLKDLLPSKEEDDADWLRKRIVSRLTEELSQSKEEVAELLEVQCSNFQSNFKVIMAFFEGIGKLVHNQRYTHLLSSYNPNLVKLIVVHYSCGLFQ